MFEKIVLSERFSENIIVIDNIQRSLHCENDIYMIKMLFDFIFLPTTNEHNRIFAKN
jgi:hypothetical protein